MINRLGIRRGIRKRHALKKLSASIFTHTTEVERSALYDMAVQCAAPRCIIEIGSYLGASTICLAAGLREGGSGTLHCVDTWQNETMPEGQRDTFCEFRNNTKEYQDIISVLRKRSNELIDGDIPHKINLAFIDGDHSYEAVRNDIATMRPWLSNGAIVAFHDSKYFPGVSKVIGECLESGFWQLHGAVDNLAWLKFLPGGVEDFGIGINGIALPARDK